ncbi:MAG: hypothetical protein ACP5NS_00385 [Candidatus Pacearchaeota archaeon]
MVNGKLLKYFIQTISIGGSRGDEFHSFPATSIYVPSRELFVKRELPSGLISGPLSWMYNVFVGDQARKEYDGLLDKLKIKPDNVDITDSFINWALANHLARNPPQEVRDILPDI